MNIIQSPSINFGKRDGYKPEMIVIHSTDGHFDSDLDWLRGIDPRSEVSAHYYLAPDGTVHQLVPDELAAWAAGLVVKPTIQLKKTMWGTNVNPNKYTLNIEVSVPPGGVYTLEQWSSLKILVPMLASRHAIPKDRAHIVGHNETRSDKTCPGSINVDNLVAELSSPQLPPPLSPTEKEEMKRKIINFIKNL